MRKWLKKYLGWMLDWHFRPVYAWHFVNDTATLSNDLDAIKARPGLTVRKWKPWRIDACRFGFHASVDVMDAYNYWLKPGYLCRVKLGGVIRYGSDKVVASRRTILWMEDVSSQLERFDSWRRKVTLSGDWPNGALQRAKLEELLKPIKEQHERHR